MPFSQSFSFFKPFCFWVVLALILSQNANAESEEQSFGGLGPFLKRNHRETIISTEFGEVSEAKVTDGNESFQLHFITLEPNSLFLPVFLNLDMVFYVHTGSGRVSYQDENEMKHRRLSRGDVFRLKTGTLFSMQSSLDSERQKLRIIAIFENSEHEFNEPASSTPYSSISNLLLGFDKEVLQAAFKVPEEVIEEILSGTKPPPIVHGLQQQKKDTMWGIMENEIMKDVYNILDLSNKHKKSKLFNIFDGKPDFENCKGWSTTVNKKKYGVLKGSKFGVFMVNLTTGAMMGPHWNPMATEIAVVLQGKGMIRVVCSSFSNETICRNRRFRVGEGDVFVVPRFHPMAQMSFNNETFVFMGFSTSIKKNHPQFFAGKASVLRTLDKHIVATSFGVNDTTSERLLAQQDDSVILDCTSCAEEEWMRLEEEIKKEKQREKEREEEARKKEEERRREEEEQRRREEEEARKKQEEEAERKREEEEERRREQEEKEAQERAEEEARKKREEEEAKRRREEEEERERQEQQQREQEEREAREREREQEEEAERERERQEQQQREQEEREASERAREQEAEREREAEAEAQRRSEEEERERQEQQQQQEEAEREREAEAEAEAQRKKEEERERQEQQQREQEQEREEEQAREAEREREEEAAREAEREREEEAAREAEEAAHGQGGSEGGGKGWQPEGGQGERTPEEKGGEGWARDFVLPSI